MSYVDKKLEFSDGQAITATAASTVVKEAPFADGNFAGRPKMTLMFNVSVAFNTLTSLTIALISDTAADLVTAPVTHCSRVIALADLVAGSKFVIGVPTGEVGGEFLGVLYTVTGTNPTTGTVDCFLAIDGEEEFPGASAHLH